MENLEFQFKFGISSIYHFQADSKNQKNNRQKFYEHFRFLSTKYCNSLKKDFLYIEFAIFKFEI